ncbi:MAG: nucleoside transporter C-terminal domain-containing protein [Steroidobacteraceae bacterium]
MIPGGGDIEAEATVGFGDSSTLGRLFGWVFAPVVWLYGIPWHEAGTAGALMGDKTGLHAMCGFANPGSVGIMIACMGGLIPERRRELVSLVMRALLSGTLATGLTGAIIGLLPIA